MDSMESGFHEQFAERLCQALGPDESLYQLFRFLLEKIPADRICCASIDLRPRLMRIMADYTPAREHGGWGQGAYRTSWIGTRLQRVLKDGAEILCL